MSNAFKILANSLLAVLLLVDAGGPQSEKPGNKQLDTSTRDVEWVQNGKTYRAKKMK
jgi:hypothetical protein